MNFIRNQFPALKDDKILFDNAGGTQVARQVGERLMDYLYNTNVQLGASYETSQLSTNRVDEARKSWAKMINANDDAEVIFGSSTTQLLRNLSRSMVQTFKPGDEVIVTNCDHEANIGPWLEMQKSGIVVKSWKINPENFKLEISDLEKLLTNKTRLVAFTHASNILGMINPVKEITEFAHHNGAKVCIDGVAYAPHRSIDVKEIGADFYVFSFYKVYGPHISLLYGKKEHLGKMPGINHFFIGEDEIPYKFQPGNVNYELSYASLGIIDYFNIQYNHFFGESNIPDKEKYKSVFKMFAEHEEKLSETFIDFLRSKREVNIIGEAQADQHIRVPTISFIVNGRKSNTIPPMIDPHNIGIRWGDFYARRLITDLGLLHHDGVIRVSMVHYNTTAEINRLITALDSIL